MAAAPPSKASVGPPLPTPTFGPGGSFAVSCSARIAAPPKSCLDVIVNASEYSVWNRFCRKCTIDAQPAASAPATQAGEGTAGRDKLQLGTQFTFDVHMPPRSSSADNHATTTTTIATTTRQAVALEVSLLEPIDEPCTASDGRPPVFPPSPEGGNDDKGATAAAPSRRKGWRIAWRQRNGWLMPGWLLRSERVQEFVEVGDGNETAYYCWETFYGVLAPVVRMAVGAAVERGFELWAEGLRGRVEKKEVGEE
ncbi:hypothetical protein VTK26DRAFT_2781 [Humicola hyalothermophila]